MPAAAPYVPAPAPVYKAAPAPAPAPVEVLVNIPRTIPTTYLAFQKLYMLQTLENHAVPIKF